MVDTSEPEVPEPENPEPEEPSHSIKANINSISYDFTITGITDETSLIFNVMTKNWETVSKTIELNGDGEYSVNLDFNNAEGLISPKKKYALYKERAVR